MREERRVGQIVVLEPELQTIRDVLHERIAGALLGGSIADALGWPTEFAKKPEDLRFVGLTFPVKEFRPWHKRTGGRFFARTDNVQPGDYSDDTQLALALARSIGPEGTVDNEYFARSELRYWLDYARGAGATVTAAAKAASRTRSDWRRNFFRYKRGNRDLDYRDAGANGAAMRVAPIALANVRDPDAVYLETWKNAIVTHGHPRAILGAVVFAEALRRIARGHEQGPAEFVADLRDFVRASRAPVDDPDVAYWLEGWNSGVNRFERLWPEYVTEMDTMLGLALDGRQGPLSETYRRLGCFAPATKGSGTASVAAALALFLRHEENFEQLTIEGANLLGSDTDTITAMAASMGGAWLGYEAIPERWASLMADYTYLNQVAEYLTLVSLRQVLSNSIKPRVGVEPSENMRLLGAMKRQDVQDRRPYWHPLFGTGRVIKAESQNVGLKQPRGRVVMATVQFEFGQTCKFSSFQSVPKAASSPPRRASKKTSQIPFDF
ncbi:MAG: ADP-ribosylglycohydrolase family protein [Chloroflexi bacterium]|nr:ADP-ribosylglycohydrolase family protein [Chloroflexota bacterium]